MPRANRKFVPGHVWHLTQRCHKKEFLLKFARDRDCWLRWLFKAKKRYGLCILNYVVTSNHIHLLVKDTGNGAIPSSMQLAAAQTAQRYNQRKNRQGAFWQDRYHATAVQTGEHLRNCVTYVDLNMVRAGVVQHPATWRHGGYREIQAPKQRYRLVDMRALTELCGLTSPSDLQVAQRTWVESALRENRLERDDRWTQWPAVGTDEFIEQFEEIARNDSPEISEPFVPYSCGFMA